MVKAPCHLAYLLLPGMQQRGFGRIINVASLAGLVPGSAGHTLYAASKAFLIKFSQSLALEKLPRWGVHVCAVCPGFYLFRISRRHGHSRRRIENAEMDVAERRGSSRAQGVDAVEHGENRLRHRPRQFARSRR